MSVNLCVHCVFPPRCSMKMTVTLEDLHLKTRKIYVANLGHKIECCPNSLDLFHGSMWEITHCEWGQNLEDNWTNPLSVTFKADKSNFWFPPVSKSLWFPVGAGGDISCTSLPQSCLQSCLLLWFIRAASSSRFLLFPQQKAHWIVPRYMDWLKMIRIAAFQDGCGFQTWNLCGPAALQGYWIASPFGWITKIF